MNIRSVTEHDIESIATLSGELGYPTRAEDVGRRLAKIVTTEDHAVYVAEGSDGSVVGWIHVFGAFRVESEPFAEIGGLVVAVAHRGGGIGRLLCERASQWAGDHGFPALRVRTRAERAAAHRFYERIGFSRAKTQEIFSRSVATR